MIVFVDIVFIISESVHLSCGGPVMGVGQIMRMIKVWRWSSQGDLVMGMVKL
jgi:uncharacterized protein YodC (DUF2158 family)